MGEEAKGVSRSRNGLTRSNVLSFVSPRRNTPVSPPINKKKEKREGKLNGLNNIGEGPKHGDLELEVNHPCVNYLCPRKQKEASNGGDQFIVIWLNKKGKPRLTGRTYGEGPFQSEKKYSRGRNRSDDYTQLYGSSKGRKR